MERQIILAFCKKRMGKRHMVYVPERKQWEILRLIGRCLDKGNEALSFECNGFVNGIYHVYAWNIEVQVKQVW